MPQMRLESASLILRLLFTVVAKMLDQNGSGLSNGQWVHHSNGSNELSMVSVFTIAILHCMKMMQKTILNACTVKRKQCFSSKGSQFCSRSLPQNIIIHSIATSCTYACIPPRCVWCFVPFFWDSYASALCTPLYLDGNYGNEIILLDTGPHLNYKLPKSARQHIHMLNDNGQATHNSIN